MYAPPNIRNRVLAIHFSLHALLAVHLSLPSANHLLPTTTILIVVFIFHVLFFIVYYKCVYL